MSFEETGHKLRCAKCGKGSGSLDPERRAMVEYAVNSHAGSQSAILVNLMNLCQLIQQRLRLLEVRRVEAFREPALDRSKEGAGFRSLSLVAPNPPRPLYL